MPNKNASATTQQTVSKHELAVVIGRMQPLHLGHQALLREALRVADKVLVVLGSSDQARDPKNPFTWQERSHFVAASIPKSEWSRVSICPVRDFHDDARWASAVRRAAASVEGVSSSPGKIALVGCFKDASSAYLNRFPGWTLHALPKSHDIDATSLRKVLFDGDYGFDARSAVLSPYVPPGVNDLIRCYANLPWFGTVKAEHQALEDYKQKWPFRVAVTTDAVVRARDHILMIRRGGTIGNGLWALPGGFLEPDEDIFAGALRELREETRIGLIDELMTHSLKGVQVFSHPQRSLRGRIITHAHYFDIGSPKHLPEVKGSDDAKLAKWVSIDQLPSMRSEMFEDHAMILEHFLKDTALAKDQAPVVVPLPDPGPRPGDELAERVISSLKVPDSNTGAKRQPGA
jgi:bifunctional NMN adenylyltransferase/nudix hydrolase